MNELVASQNKGSQAEFQQLKVVIQGLTEENETFRNQVEQAKTATITLDAKLAKSEELVTIHLRPILFFFHDIFFFSFLFLQGWIEGKDFERS